MSFMSWTPGMYRHDRPISVARPTASSTASSPAMRRTFMLRPRRAAKIYASTAPQRTMSRPRNQMRVGSSQLISRSRDRRAGAFYQFHVGSRDDNTLARFKRHLEHSCLRTGLEGLGLGRQRRDLTDEPEVRIANDSNWRAYGESPSGCRRCGLDAPIGLQRK